MKTMTLLLLAVAFTGCVSMDRNALAVVILKNPKELPKGCQNLSNIESISVWDDGLAQGYLRNSAAEIKATHVLLTEETHDFFGNRYLGEAYRCDGHTF